MRRFWGNGGRVQDSPCCYYRCCPEEGSVQDVGRLGSFFWTELAASVSCEDGGVRCDSKARKEREETCLFLFCAFIFILFGLLLYIKRLSCRTLLFFCFITRLSLNPNSEYCTSTLNPSPNLLALYYTNNTHNFSLSLSLILFLYLSITHTHTHTYDSLES